MIDKASAWARLPGELKALPQWAVSAANKAPLSIDAQGRVFNASVVKPGEWLTFEQAARLAWDNRETVTEHRGRTQTGYDIGFILNESDPFTCIDLDVKDAVSHPEEPHLWSTSDDFNRYLSIVNTFDSYTERSKSGKGLHIWVEGSIGQGFRRDGVEIYSRDRYIISTGDSVGPVKPVAHRQSTLENMVTQMRPAATQTELIEFEREVQDWYILGMAAGAENKEKFLKLYGGQWKELGFPSQSEADLALMSMFTFYSKSNEQCRNLFRCSELGKREKATKDDRYLNFTLKTVRDRQTREEAVNLNGFNQSLEYRERLAAQAVQQLQGGAALGHSTSLSVPSLHTTGQGDPALAPVPAEIAAASIAPISGDILAAGETGLPWPPGFAGHIAHFMYHSAPRPVKEVAIVGTLGLLAGICGKAWHIPQSGLNLYIILVARSAIGKEAMHSGISAIIKACSRENPMFHKFVSFMEYASGPALTKACVGNPCFVNVSGEWGKRLKMMAADERGVGPLQTLRTKMTELYQKSGPQAIVGGLGYSSTDNNVESIAGVSYSMIGETTPGTFYEALTETMMEDGFLSRFLIIEYEGDRPDPNRNAELIPDDSIKRCLNNMSTQADMFIAKEHSHPIGRTEEVAIIMDQFEKECDAQIRGTKDESRRQMWNRAALKTLRIAGLLAVADNYLTPCITKEHFEWAQLVVRRDISVMKRRLESGDVGSGDSSRERKMVAVLKDYLLHPPAKSYGVPANMQADGIVPRSYIQTRIHRAAAFYNHKNGANKAADDILQNMLLSGYLIEVPKDKVFAGYKYHGKSYRIVNLPDYDDPVLN